MSSNYLKGPNSTFHFFGPSADSELPSTGSTSRRQWVAPVYLQLLWCWWGTRHMIMMSTAIGKTGGLREWWWWWWWWWRWRVYVNDNIVMILLLLLLLLMMMTMMMMMMMMMLTAVANASDDQRATTWWVCQELHSWILRESLKQSLLLFCCHSNLSVNYDSLCNIVIYLLPAAAALCLCLHSRRTLILSCEAVLRL